MLKNVGCKVFKFIHKFRIKTQNKSKNFKRFFLNNNLVIMILKDNSEYKII